MKKVFLTTRSRPVRAAIEEDGKINEFLVQDVAKVDEVGHIYLGKVEKVLQGMDTAFINIGSEQNGFLQKEHLASFKQDQLPISKLIHEGEQIVVQVVKESYANKGPSLTNIIELTGKYLVYLPEGDYVAISKKMTTDREKWQQLADNWRMGVEGLIFRTTCIDATPDLVYKELEWLRANWASMQKKCKEVKAPTLLHSNSNLIDVITRDIALTTKDEVIVDEQVTFKKLQQSFDIYGTAKPDIQLFIEKQDLFSAFAIEHELEKAFLPHVWLKNGATLKIEQTEALTVIDINSTKFTGKNNKQDTILKVNEEAAKEIARQLRLRNIGGIILIDFINMTSDINRQKVIDVLNTALKTDKLFAKVIGFTRLGLLEMTRKKAKRSLAESFTQPCTICSGTGLVLSDQETMAKLERTLFDYKGSDHEAIWLEVSEKVQSLLDIDDLEKKLYMTLVVTVNAQVRDFLIRHVGDLQDIQARIARH